MIVRPTTIFKVYYRPAGSRSAPKAKKVPAKIADEAAMAVRCMAELNGKKVEIVKVEQ